MVSARLGPFLLLLTTMVLSTPLRPSIIWEGEHHWVAAKPNFDDWETPRFKTSKDTPQKVETSPELEKPEKSDKPDDQKQIPEDEDKTEEVNTREKEKSEEAESKNPKSEEKEPKDSTESTKSAQTKSSRKTHLRQYKVVAIGRDYITLVDPEDPKSNTGLLKLSRPRIVDYYLELILSFIIFGVAFPMIYYNERATLRRKKILTKGEEICESASIIGIDPMNQGKLLQIQGWTFADTDLQDDRITCIQISNAMRLDRIVEMLQYEQIDDDEFELVWRRYPVDDEKYPEEYQTPSADNWVLPNKVYRPNTVMLGDFRLSRLQMHHLNRPIPFRLTIGIIDTIKECVMGLGADLLNNSSSDHGNSQEMPKLEDEREQENDESHREEVKEENEESEKEKEEREEEEEIDELLASEDHESQLMVQDDQTHSFVTFEGNTLLIKKTRQEDTPGDLKITWTYVPCREVTLIGRQSDNYIIPWEYDEERRNQKKQENNAIPKTKGTSTNNQSKPTDDEDEDGSGGGFCWCGGVRGFFYDRIPREIYFVHMGLVSEEDLFSGEMSKTSQSRWGIRFVGWILLASAILISLPPFREYLGVLPIVKRLPTVGVQIFAFVFATILFLITYWMAWKKAKPFTTKLVAFLIIAIIVGMAVL